VDDNLFTPKQVADRLNMNETTLYRYINNGMIPIVFLSKKKRFIRKEDLEKFIKEHTGVYQPTPKINDITVNQDKTGGVN
jgi:excisionase family DNA binding protein